MFVHKINVVGLEGQKSWDINAGVLLVVDSAFAFMSVAHVFCEEATGDGTDGRLVKRVRSCTLNPSCFLCQ